MIDEKVGIPLDDPSLSVRVMALYRGPDAGPFAYLQGMRSGRLKLIFAEPEDSERAQSYHRNKERYFGELANAVGDEIDAVVSPPSRSPWQADPYREAIIAKQSQVIDLTSRFEGTKTALASEGADTEDIVGELSYQPAGDEGTIKRLVIVDDTFEKGSTASAIVRVLTRHGLAHGCEIIVACPLWLTPKKPPSIVT